MKLAIDCRYIGISGIGTYVEGFIDVLLKEYHDNQYLLITNKDLPYQNTNNIEILKTSIRPFSIMELLFFPVHKINKCDAFFTPYINIPLYIKIPIFSTIHDVIFLDIPDLTSKIGVLIRKLYYLMAIKRSKAIFSVSEFSKSRIQYHFNTKKPIIVTYSAISEYIKKNKENTFQEKNDYFIYVGNIKSHKGLRCLISAYKKAKIENLSSKLYIVGERSSFRTEDKEFEDCINDENIHFTGYVNDSLLVKLIKEAKALVLPSKYEGLGLPPLEALFLGTNVILSDIDVFKEIYKNLPVTFFKVGDDVDLKNVLLDNYPKTFDIKSVRYKINSIYNFSSITNKILDTINSYL